MTFVLEIDHVDHLNLTLNIVSCVLHNNLATIYLTLTFVSCVLHNNLATIYLTLHFELRSYSMTLILHILTWLLKYHILNSLQMAKLFIFKQNCSSSEQTKYKFRICLQLSFYHPHFKMCTYQELNQYEPFPRPCEC